MGFDFENKILRTRHVFDNRNLEVIVLRVEEGHQWEAMLRPIFPNFQMRVFNTGSSHGAGYESKYKEFLSALQYTDMEIEHVSQSDEFSQFYTREERDEFIKAARNPAMRSSGIHIDDLFSDEWFELQGDPAFMPSLPQC